MRFGVGLWARGGGGGGYLVFFLWVGWGALAVFGGSLELGLLWAPIVITGFLSTEDSFEPDRTEQNIYSSFCFAFCLL
ncbi:hypothetical protein DFP73DRAFT_550005 [Morchella snyderi]|nr:hypothetical protein DFP73DRAFT_550005 [Morchella snyderi]